MERTMSRVIFLSAESQARTWKKSSFLHSAQSASRGRETEPHIACRSIRPLSASCTSRGGLLSHSGDGSIARRGGSTEVASSGAFGDLLEPLYLVGHRLLEDRPHMQPEAKNEGFQWLAPALLYLTHDLLRESDHREEGYNRWHGIQRSLYECLRMCGHELKVRHGSGKSRRN